MSETSGEKLNIEYKQEYVSDIKKRSNCICKC